MQMFAQQVVIKPTVNTRVVRMHSTTHRETSIACVRAHVRWPPIPMMHNYVTQHDDDDAEKTFAFRPRL